MATYFIVTLTGQFSGTLELHTLSPWAELVKANEPLRCLETLPGSVDYGGSLTDSDHAMWCHTSSSLHCTALYCFDTLLGTGE
jgi:hypothetical protein